MENGLSGEKEENAVVCCNISSDDEREVGGKRIKTKISTVSTVLLYGIPIVSLYIEGQERLCLAQISNTLLKAYSYNEIHNRRVALGITCVQCTPVQLEILRRAGAMPVSSRRCGMITRREAERLCKSFLGDNSPPRLPEDFAFNVQHKCAWGCRGSFLPSRYNSSRAKCIKCSFCGMFFSPNKFIFHSHRMSASDKYVQPDAANFNSWRRHMFLSGQPLEEIVHAWEDVKAMFNGGTRKRLLHSGGSTKYPRAEHSISADIQPTATKDDSLVPTKRTRKPSGSEKKNGGEESLMRNASYSKVPSVENINTIRSSIIVPQCFPQLQANPNSLGVPSLQISAFDSQLMVDYMIQTHQQQQQKVKNGNNCQTFSFPNCTPIPWLKGPTCSPPFKCISTNELRTNSSLASSLLTSNNYSVPSLLNTSAFKPVLQQNFQKGKPSINAVAAAATFVSSSMYTCDTNTTSSTNPPNTLPDFTSFTPSSRISFPTSVVIRGQTFSPLSPVKDQPLSDDDENVGGRLLQNGNSEDEDEIEVDIETTEDDPKILNCKESKIVFSEPTKDNFVENDVGVIEIGSDNRESSKVFHSFYKSRSLTEINDPEGFTNEKETRCSSRSRQCSCSSSNDSLYMSAQTKSERESSSRATSTISLEIHNEDDSNTKPAQLQDSVNMCTPTWRKISKQGEEQHNILKEPGSRKTLSNIIRSDLPMKSQKLTTEEPMDIGADQHITAKSASVPNNAVAVFDTIHANCRNHISTSISNHDKTCNTYNHDLWHVASLCLHRPHLPHNLSNSTYCSRQYNAASQD